MCVIMMCI